MKTLLLLSIMFFASSAKSNELVQACFQAMNVTVDSQWAQNASGGAAAALPITEKAFPRLTFDPGYLSAQPDKDTLKFSPELKDKLLFSADNNQYYLAKKTENGYEYFQVKAFLEGCPAPKDTKNNAFAMPKVDLGNEQSLNVYCRKGSGGNQSGICMPKDFAGDPADSSFCVVHANSMYSNFEISDTNVNSPTQVKITSNVFMSRFGERAARLLKAAILDWNSDSRYRGLTKDNIPDAAERFKTAILDIQKSCKGLVPDESLASLNKILTDLKIEISEPHKSNTVRGSRGKH